MRLRIVAPFVIALISCLGPLGTGAIGQQFEFCDYAEWYGIFSGGLEDEFVISVFNVGVDHYVTDNFVLDWRAGVGLSDDSDDFFTGIGGGCCANHSPHHAPKEWIEKFEGKFDMGWDKYREETLVRQKKLGVVPQDTMLTARSEGLPA